MRIECLLETPLVEFSASFEFGKSILKWEGMNIKCRADFLPVNIP